MLENPMSAATSPRPGAENTDVQPFGTRLQVQRPRPRRSDERLLALLGEHQVLTTSQLVRLTGVPERTAQHRLGTLCRAGLVSRYRPRAVVGTCPYHWWLTPFGATAIGTKPPEPWSDRLACVRTVAALSDLWLGIEDHGLAAGLSLTGWRRLPDGLSVRDPHTGVDRRLAADAELRFRLDGQMDVQALVFARVDRIPRARLVSVLARWAASLAAAAPARPRLAPTAALVLTRTERQRATVVAAARDVADANDRLAVGAVERDSTLASDALWRTPADEDDRRLVDVLAGLAQEAGE